MSVIDEYLNELPPPQKDELSRIRKIIITTVPEVEEAISYGMPEFKYKNKYLIGFSIFRDHMSLFPTPSPINALKSRLGGYKLSKGTIQFNLGYTIPEPLIRNLILYRVDEIDRLSESESI